MALGGTHASACSSGCLDRLNDPGEKAHLAICVVPLHSRAMPGSSKTLELQWLPSDTGYRDRPKSR